MADPYFNSQSLYSVFQKAYESVMSNSGLAFKGSPQQSGLVFGLRVDQTAPSNYVNPLISYGESFHNPLNDSCFKKMPVSVIYSQEYEQSEPLVLSHKPNPLPNNQNFVCPFSAPTVPISIINPQLNEQLQQNTFPAGNKLGVNASASGFGESLTISHDKVYARSEKQKAYRKAYAQSEKGKASQKAYRESEKGKASRKAYRESEKGKASQRACQKTYEQSRKGKASRKAYRESEKGKASRKAYQKAYRESEKGEASKPAREKSEKGTTYAQSGKWQTDRKAYYKAFKNTGDKEQAKIAGKQAVALIRESNKAKNNELESTSTGITPAAFQIA